MTSFYFTLFEEKISEEIFLRKLNTLPDALREKVSKYWRWQDAYASLFGKLLLLEGFFDFGISAGLEDLAYTKFGKPYLPGSPVSFNISHSEHCVVCILTDEAESIGVDIERIRPINIKGYYNLWSPLEWEQIIFGTPKVFFNHWTRKEAVLKADGRGLGIPLKEISVCADEVDLNRKKYFLGSCDFHVNYVLHFASETRIRSITQIRVDPDSTPRNKIAFGAAVV